MKHNLPIDLYLIRHGNTFTSTDKVVQVGLKTNMPLTEQGLLQAKQLGQYFAVNNLIPSSIYTGTLLRQKQTAQTISQALYLYSNCPIHQEHALEEIDYGLWEGLTTEEITEHWANQLKDWEESLHWPENIFQGKFVDKKLALQNWIQHISKTHPPGSLILAVSSNGVIRCILSLIGNLWDKIVHEKRLRDYKVKTGHFCHLALQDGNLTIQTWNQSPLK